MLMTYRQLFHLMRLANLSPEQFGRLLGISGMTLRRWKRMPPDGVLPDIYGGAATRAVHKLVAEGRLSSESPAVRKILGGQWLPFHLAAEGLGIPSDTLEKLKQHPAGALDTLTAIGSSDEKRSFVDASTATLRRFGNKGKDWAYRIRKLRTIIQSKELRAIEKVVAYGALFYLLNPFDFIPDHVPVFGFLDDFFFLSAALTFYLRRYPKILGD